jgi:hypothetical protein
MVVGSYLSVDLALVAEVLHHCFLQLVAAPKNYAGFFLSRTLSLVSRGSRNSVCGLSLGGEAIE